MGVLFLPTEFRRWSFAGQKRELMSKSVCSFFKVFEGFRRLPCTRAQACSLVPVSSRLLLVSLRLLPAMIFLVSCGPPLPDSLSGPASQPYGTSSYSQAGVEYFWEIGLCFEGEVCPVPRVVKWETAIRIQLAGQYTPVDERELDNIIGELSQLTGLSISRTTGEGNINIYIVPQDQFVSYCKAYDPNNTQDGHFELRDLNNVVQYANICIENTTNEQLKRHLLREELTQVLGLGNDSYKYTHSVFQQDPQYQPTQYAEIDKELIKLLYDKRIKPGMTRGEIDQILTAPTSPAQVAWAEGHRSDLILSVGG